MLSQNTECNKTPQRTVTRFMLKVIKMLCCKNVGQRKHRIDMSENCIIVIVKDGACIIIWKVSIWFHKVWVVYAVAVNDSYLSTSFKRDRYNKTDYTHVCIIRKPNNPQEKACDTAKINGVVFMCMYKILVQ